MQRCKSMARAVRAAAVFIICCLLFGAVYTNMAAKGRELKTIRSVSLKIDGKKVNGTTYRIKTGQKKKIKVSVSPSKIKKSVRYTSSNKKAADVNKRGFITAKKVGTALIKVAVSAKNYRVRTVRVKVRVTAGSPGPAEAVTEQPKITEKPETTEQPSASEQPETTDNPTVTEHPSETQIPVISEPPSETDKPEQPVTTAVPDIPSNKKNIVVYFSCTDNTKTIAEYTAEIADADIYRIEAAEPYTAADLDYHNSESRTSKENRDASARPKIEGSLPDLSGYENIYIGYPIWHGQAPKIMYTFIESGGMSGKTVIPFCTSASSGVGTSAANLQKADSGGNVWLEGRRFSGSSPKTDVENWIRSRDSRDIS